MTAAPSATVATREQPQLTTFEIIERVITQGDLAKMTPQDRIAFYWRTCESLGLNPLTRPFEFITLNGKLTLYTRKDATDQLRKLNAVTVTQLRREKDDDLGLLTVYARGRDRTGREDEATGVVFIKGLSGEALANATMKAETKAKRRLTLSLVGLGFLDESEVEGAERVDVDPATGEITERPKPKTLLESVAAQRQAMATTPAPGPAAAADDTVEGSFTDLTAADPAAGQEPATAPTAPQDAAIDLATTIRAAAAASDLEGPASKARITTVMGAVFDGWDRDRVSDGIRAIYGPEGISHPTAAQVHALQVVADSVSAEAFAAGWDAAIAAAKGEAA